jgi:hypothetical protein
MSNITRDLITRDLGKVDWKKDKYNVYEVEFQNKFYKLSWVHHRPKIFSRYTRNKFTGRNQNGHWDITDVSSGTVIATRSNLESCKQWIRINLGEKICIN